jgi:phenylalanyl-tRNA synthetase beta subunit
MVAWSWSSHKLLSLPKQPHFYQAEPVYPSSVRDLTVTLPQSIPLATVMQAAEKQIDRSIVRSWLIQDIFRASH